MIAAPPLELEEIELQQELARASVAGFIRYRYAALGRRILWTWHLDLLSEILGAITTHQLTRTLISMPPRFLKSETVTQAWQAWMIGRDNSPRSSVVSASYAASLAHRDSRKTMEILASPWFQGIFGEIPMQKSQQDDWETVGGASRAAAGALGPITGKGGDHLVGDDLLKPSDANSELVREKTNEWIGETFRSRFNDIKTGTMTIIAQRLHERDPIGFLTEQMRNPDGDQWHIVNLPLENIHHKAVLYSFGRFKYLRKRDELLHPARIGLKEVKAMKVAMRANFEGQYNQRPQKMTGGKFRPALLGRVDKPAEAIAKEFGLTVTFYIDLATKEKEVNKDDPDFSVIAVMARDQLQRKWILDLWYRQCSADVTAGACLDLWEKWRKLGCGPRFIKGERIGLQHMFKPVLLGVCRQRNAGMLPLLDFPYSRDATLKLAPFEGALNAGQVWVPGAATWLPDLEAQMRSIPKGAHDDLATAISQGIQDLENQAAGDAHPIPEEQPTLRGIPGKSMLKEFEKRKKALLGEDEDD